MHWTQRVYNNFKFGEDGDQLKLDNIYEKYKGYLLYVCPKRNLTFARYILFTYRQGDTQTFNNYYSELRKLASDCELATLYDSLVKDMIVLEGSIIRTCKKHYFRDNNLNLDKTIHTCQSVKLTHKQAVAMQQSSIKELDIDLVDRHKCSTFYKTEIQTQ